MLAQLRGQQPMSASRPDFREVHDTLRPRVLRYLARMAGEAEAEDLAQEVFAKVSRSLENFRGDAEFRRGYTGSPPTRPWTAFAGGGSRRIRSIRWPRKPLSLPGASATRGPTRSGRRWKGA